MSDDTTRLKEQLAEKELRIIALENRIHQIVYSFDRLQGQLAEASRFTRGKSKDAK